MALAHLDLRTLACFSLWSLTLACSDAAPDAARSGTAGSDGSGLSGGAGGAGSAAGAAGTGGSGAKSPFDGTKRTEASALAGSRLYTLTSVGGEDSFLSVLTVDDVGGLDLNGTLPTPRNPVAVIPQGDKVILFFDADQPLWEGIPRPDFRKETEIWMVDVRDPASPKWLAELPVNGLYAGSFAANAGYYVVTRAVRDTTPATTTVTSFAITGSQLVLRGWFDTSDPTGHWLLPRIAFDDRHLVITDWSDERFDGFRQLNLLPDGSIVSGGVRRFRGDWEVASQVRVVDDQLTAVSLPKSGGAALEVFNLTDSGPERLNEITTPGEPSGPVAGARVTDTEAFIGGQTTLFATMDGGSWLSLAMQAPSEQTEPLGSDWLVAGQSNVPNQISLTQVAASGNALTATQSVWVPPVPSRREAGAVVLESGLVLVPWGSYSTNDPSAGLRVYDTTSGTLTARGELPLTQSTAAMFQHANTVLLVSDGYVTSVSVDDPDAPRQIARQPLF